MSIPKTYDQGRGFDDVYLPIDLVLYAKIDGAVTDTQELKLQVQLTT